MITVLSGLVLKLRPGARLSGAGKSSARLSASIPREQMRTCLPYANQWSHSAADHSSHRLPLVQERTYRRGESMRNVTRTGSADRSLVTVAVRTVAVRSAWAVLSKRLARQARYQHRTSQRQKSKSLHRNFLHRNKPGRVRQATQGPAQQNSRSSRTMITAASARFKRMFTYRA